MVSATIVRDANEATHVNKGNGDDHHTGEEHVNSETHLGEHLRGEPRDQEREQPVGSRDDGLSGGPDESGHDLRTVNPGGTVETGRVEDGPDVEEGDGRGTSGREWGSWGIVLRLGDGDVSSDVVHGERSTGGTDHEDGLSSESIDEVEQPDDGTQKLDETKDTGRQQGSVGSGDTDGLEYGGRVIVDGVDTGSVLHGKEGDGDGQSLQVGV